MILIIVIFGVMFALFAGASTMLFFGVRGRLVLGRTRCRRCDYQVDVDGQDDAICTECGMDLQEPNAIRHDQKVRSRLMIVSSVVLYLVCLATPFVIVAVRAISMAPQGIATANAARAAGNKPTWLRPLSETPDKKEHMEWELQGIGNPELLNALEIRPMDNGLWWTLQRRAETDAFTDDEMEFVFDRILDRQEAMKQDGTTSNQQVAASGMNIDEVIEAVTLRVDPNKPENIERMARLLPSIMDIPPRKTAAANQSWKITLFPSYAFPISWQHAFETLEVRLGDQVLDPSQHTTGTSHITVDVPAVLDDGEGRPTELAVSLRVSIDTDESSWVVPLELTIPVDVIPTGSAGVEYDESEELVPTLQDLFNGIRVVAWHPEGEDQSTHVSVVIPALSHRKGPGAANFNSTLPNVNARPMPGMKNRIGVEFDENWSNSFGSNSVHGWLLDPEFNEPTIDVNFEPEFLAEPTAYTRKMGLPGVRVRLEDVPIRWLDTGSDPNLPDSPEFRAERIEGPEDSPLFGPSRMGPTDDADRNARFMEWLSPRILLIPRRDGKIATRLQFGSPGDPPQPAMLRMRSLDPETRDCTLLVPIDGESDAPRTQTLAVIGEALEPGTTFSVEFRGFPACERRDRRSDAEWFGGVVNADIPVYEGMRDRETGKYVIRDRTEETQ